ncbi:hypothetical protein [Jiangella asiatica]|uniref:DUF1579 domain-containing protein n=1 Tax=Jiangella asiatica TaxID=2530372 RepID=A0A4R5DEK1_9ACTN|nr:hypothetical protein [Jiangella asiatica]TDE12209.1 hypothetical protein E1269_07935 [Jiangella asiatica]
MWLDRLLGSWRFTMNHSAMPEPVTGRQRYVGRFRGADAIDCAGEYSRDLGATWQHDFTMTCSRIE